MVLFGGWDAARPGAWFDQGEPNSPLVKQIRARHSYGAVAPHVVLPFVVEHAGALGKDADKFFHAIVKKVRNELNASEEAESSWSSRGFSNFYYQRISVANLKGLGHFFLVAEALLRSAGNVPFGS